MGRYADEKEVKERVYERLRTSGVQIEKARDLADTATGSAFDKKGKTPREKRPPKE